ncbi:MAG: hypothetical protein ACREIA_07950 [Opitutaceae bacterium]
MIFAKGEYWAVGSNGNVQHSANGSAWEVVQTPALATLRSITYGQGRFVAVGSNLTIISSTNGLDWEAHMQDPSSCTAPGKGRSRRTTTGKPSRTRRP